MTDGPPPGPRVVLVTGVARDLAGRVVRRLSDDPSIEQVIGVDLLPPLTRRVAVSSSGPTSAVPCWPDLRTERSPMPWPWPRRQRSRGAPATPPAAHEAAPAFADVPSHDSRGRLVRVSVLSRDRCHLCVEAVAVVAEVAEQAGVGWVERDVDDTVELVPRYGDLVPVVFVDGREVARWRVEPAALARALRR